MIPKPVVLVLACGRPRYLDRALRSICRAINGFDLPIVVSEQGSDPRILKVLSRYPSDIVHIRFPQSVPFEIPSHANPGYYYIAEHYRKALLTLFEDSQFENVIIVEDDLEVAPDFFSFFHDLYPLLEMDPSIWSLSAWSDNGSPKFAKDPRALYRSDFFPGLGWLMTKSLWNELGSDWPELHWDEWMRYPEQRKGRVTIRPEVSRTYTFGKKGVSKGQYYKSYLRKVKLNDNLIRFRESDLSALTKEVYDRKLKGGLAAAIQVDSKKLPRNSKADLRIEYDSVDEFQSLAKKFGLMQDVWSDVPRTGYKGVVSFRRGERLVFLYPKDTVL